MRRLLFPWLLLGCLVSLFPLQPARALESDKLPPPNLRQVNIRFNIQQGSGLYESSGSFVCSPDPQSNNYALYALSSNILNGEGTYLYARTSSRTARLVSEAAVGSTSDAAASSTIDLTFETEIFGRFEVNSILGAQSGTFQIFPKLGETETLALRDENDLEIMAPA